MKYTRYFLPAALTAALACSNPPAGPDSGIDSGMDSGVDAGRDAGADAGRDAGADAGPDAGRDAGVPDSGPYTDAGLGPFCTLPGSVIYTAAGRTTVPGAATAPDFSWLTLPVGYCVHDFAHVPVVRQIRFAPGGELFVASPSTGTVSAGAGGLGGVAVVVENPDGGGFGDLLPTLFKSTPTVVGLLFANGAFYHQESTEIVSQPYVAHQLQDNGEDAVVADITVYISDDHWPKTLDVADDGTIYVGNGGDESEACEQPMPFEGGILEIDGSDGGAEVAIGFRNPVSVKCHRDGNDRCFALELTRDLSSAEGGREKLVLIHQGDDWGYPCCASANLPFANITVPCPGNPSAQCAPDCSTVAQDTNEFLVGNTPFGLDFVDDQFPAPFNDKVIVALHGNFESWAGARLVAIDFDPSTGLTLGSSTTDGGNDSSDMQDFAVGWDDGTQSHGRPTDVAMSPDGRLFVANDQNGDIFWIAPNVP